MTDKKCANKDRTSELINYNDILTLKINLKIAKTEMEKLEKKVNLAIRNDKPIGHIERLETELGVKRREYMELSLTYKQCVGDIFERLVLEGDFNLTSTCIARILDTTTDYVTRKLKTEIEYINLPLELFNLNEAILENKNIDVYKSHIYRDKMLFFSKKSFIEFLKNNLYEVGEKDIYPFDISPFLNSINGGVDLDHLTMLVSMFINKYTKSYEYENPVLYQTASDIANSNIDLVRSSTIKRFLEVEFASYKSMCIKDDILDKYDLDAIDDIEHNNKKAFNDYKQLESYYYMNRRGDILTYKNVITVQDVQVNRYMATKPHIKYHLKTGDSSKPVALFFIKEDEGTYSSGKYDGRRKFYISLEDGSVKIALDKASVKINLEENLNKFLLNNYNPELKGEDIDE
ncbi:MAG: hypothetical protein J6D47_07945 [Peptostreptococcaceae bacterium]|nr:hypothetical protein [Peptostreptococcaceae bacterium]